MIKILKILYLFFLRLLFLLLIRCSTTIILQEGMMAMSMQITAYREAGEILTAEFPYFK
ncbi:hypothetical protein [Brachyspira hyodysenteriae]|uniref:hypothetical protein n=1 Tax=Brachyspira hyodysenteriae TaxID=159 RepID=UPI0022CDB1A0|nr:hypothetical protein [Brachyspira hyodysenteriae]MCZ9966152.1 hypothetical protein [Brachyspira hyodysenteriae]